MVLLLERCGLAVTAAPGTGSTSLLTYFGAFGGAVQVPADDVVEGDTVVVDAKHAPLTEVVAAGLLDTEVRERVRIVTSTRNPFDFWAAEWHRTRTRWLAELRRPESWVHRQAGMVGRIVDAVTLAFDDWLDVVLGDDGREGRTMHLNAGHVAEADVVLRMEHLAADLAALLGAHVDALTFPHVNATDGRPPYWQLYGVRSRALVTAVHAPDLERFGYRF